jgi:hypothetical protein
MRQDGAYQKQRIDLVILDCLESGRKLEFRKYDDTVAAIYARVTDDNEAVDVRHGKQTEHVLGVVGLVAQIVDHRVSVWLLKILDLHGICDDIAMRDHDTLGQTRSAAGVAEECRLLCAIAFSPIQWFQAVELFALANEVIHCLQAFGVAFAASELTRHLKDVYAVLRDAALLGRFARSLEQWNAGEESLRTRVLQLVYELIRAIRGVCRRLDAT